MEKKEPKKIDVAYYLKQAKDLLEERKYPGADDYLEDILKVEPDNREALGLKVQALTHLGDFKQAADLGEAGKVSQDDPEALFCLGLAYYKTNQAGKAADYLTRAVELSDKTEKIPERNRYREALIKLKNGKEPFGFEATDKKQPPVPASSLLEIVTKLASFFGVIYLFGYIIVNRYYYGFGFTLDTLTSPRYLSAGLSYLIFLGIFLSPFYFLYGIYKRVRYLSFKNFKILLFPPYLLLLTGLVILLILAGCGINHNAIALLAALGLGTLYSVWRLIAMFKDRMLKTALLAVYFSGLLAFVFSWLILFLLLALIRNYADNLGLMLALVPVFYAVIFVLLLALAEIEHGIVTDRFKEFRIFSCLLGLGIFILFLFCAGLYAPVYGRIPSWLGGGELQPVKINLKGDAADPELQKTFKKENGRVQLIYNDKDYLYFALSPSPDGKYYRTYQIPMSEVQMIQRDNLK